MWADALLAITWNADPNAFTLFGFEVKWYGIAYAVAFMAGFYLTKPAFLRAGKPFKDVDALAIHIIVGVVVGARLGHCFFYQPEYYLTAEHFLEILNVRQGGMASHGATLGIIVAIYLYLRRRPDYKFWWVADALMPAVALGAILIRLANLINSEIVGHVTDLPWGFYFVNSNEMDPATGRLVGADPRHPSVLYEALCYLLVLLLVCWLVFWRKPAEKRQYPTGWLTGLTVLLIFVARLLTEFTKTEQADYIPLVPLTVGQLLSLPFIALGGWLMWRAKSSAKAPQGHA